MEVGRVLPFLMVIPASLLLTYATKREFVSVSAAVLTAYYASIGDSSMALASAVSIVTYSLAKLLMARPARVMRVVLMKFRYALITVTIIASSVPIAYIALGSALALSPLESQGAAIVVATMLYVLLGAAVAPRLSSVSSPALWRALRVESIERFLWTAGLVTGGAAMFANVVAHGALALVIMLAYLTTVLATRRLRPPAPGVAAATVAGVGAILVYMVGYA